MSQFRVCDTKILYDTEFAAEIAAAKVAHKYDSPMTHYPCGNHWHISHVHRYHRRGAGKGYIKCPDCRLILKDRANALTRHRCKEKAPSGA